MPDHPEQFPAGGGGGGATAGALLLQRVGTMTMVMKYSRYDRDAIDESAAASQIVAVRDTEPEEVVEEVVQPTQVQDAPARVDDEVEEEEEEPSQELQVYPTEQQLLRQGSALHAHRRMRRRRTAMRLRPQQSRRWVRRSLRTTQEPVSSRAKPEPRSERCERQQRRRRKRRRPRRR